MYLLSNDVDKKIAGVGVSVFRNSQTVVIPDFNFLAEDGQDMYKV